MSSLMVIIPHGLSEIVAKGEVVERYYNPGELFARVDIVMTADDRPDPAQVAAMVGNAELHLHSVPIPDGLFRRSLGFRPERVAGWVDQILRIARGVRPALVRCHGAHLNALAAQRIRDELGSPYAVSLHINPDEDVRGRASTLRDRLRFRAMVPMERAGLQGADIVLPVYESIVPYLRRMNVTRFEVAYNVVGGRHLRKKDDYALHRPVRVVSVGRLFTLKNPQNLIRAVNDLEEVELTVIGDGPLRSQLQEIACDRVRFEPAMPNAALCQFLDEQDIFATHSEHWEISKAVLEALLTGLPVVLNRRRGQPVPELQGLCVFVDDTADAYRAALRRLIADRRLRERLGREGRAAAEARWSPERTEARYAEIYHSLLNQQPKYIASR